MRLFSYIFLFLLTTWQLIAQTYPVQVVPMLTPPYSSKIADYANPMANRVQLQLITTDLSVQNRPVQLYVEIKGNGLTAASAPVLSGVSPLRISGGEILRLTNAELASYFQLRNLQGITSQQYTSALPDGMYSFCFRVKDVLSGRWLSQSHCAIAYLMLNDPPILNIPTDNEQVAVTDFQNIIFSWTPRQINATNVTYSFELREILDPTLDPRFAFEVSRRILKEDDLRMTTFVYDVSKPNLIPGRRYAWRVRAISTGGLAENSVFKNDGYSEVHSFVYAVNCSKPLFLLSQQQGKNRTKLLWQGHTLHQKYHIQYRKKGVANAQWFEASTRNTQTLITDLEAGEYEFRVGATCETERYGINPSYVYSDIQTFKIEKTQSTTESAYNCGIVPKIAITNQKPLGSLVTNEVFVAGDFSVTILEVSGNNGIFSGEGYVKVPYLQDTKIKVVFNGIKLNTDRQLIDGKLVTTYDETERNVVEVSKEIKGLKEFAEELKREIAKKKEETIALFGEQDENFDKSLEEWAKEKEREYTETAKKESEINTSVAVEDNEVKQTESPSNLQKSKETTPENSKKGDVTYYIKHKNKKYYTGDKIKLPYKRNMLETFEMGDVADTTKVNFNIYYPNGGGLKTIVAGFEKKKTFFIEKHSEELLKLDIYAFAKVPDSVGVRIEIDKEVKKFDLTELKAIDLRNGNRVAKSGETLYYVNFPSIEKERRDTQFIAEIKPNIPKEEIPVSFINWTVNSKEFETNQGELDFKTSINEKQDKKITVKTGNPTQTSKSVQIKWVDEDRHDASFMPPAVNHIVQELSKNVITPLQKALDKINGFIGSDIKAEINPIKIKGEAFNEEDDNSRYFFKTLEGTINGGISVSGEFMGYPPFLKILNIKDVSKVGLYISPRIEFSVAGGGTRRELGNTKKTVKDEMFLEASLKGCIEIGLKAELLAAKKYVDFYVSGFGEGCGSGKLKYSFTKQEFEGGVYLDPIILGVKAKIKSKGVLEFELVDIDKSWSITDKIPLKEGRFKL